MQIWRGFNGFTKDQGAQSPNSASLVNYDLASSGNLLHPIKILVKGNHWSLQSILAIAKVTVLNNLLVILYCWRQHLHNSLNNQLYIHWLSNILQSMLLNIFHNSFQFYNLFFSIFLFHFNSFFSGIFSIIWLNFCDF